MRINLLPAVLTALVIEGCAPATQIPPDAARRGSGNVITAEEIARENVSSAFEAVERLRPQFLRSRGKTSTDSRDEPTTAQPLPVVYMDETRFGGIASLRDIPVSDIKEIRYISPSDATTMWGTGHANGVIQIVRAMRRQ